MAEAPKRKRTFRKFSYRGVDLDQLLELSTDSVSLPSPFPQASIRVVNERRKSLVTHIFVWPSDTGAARSSQSHRPWTPAKMHAEGGTAYCPRTTRAWGWASPSCGVGGKMTPDSGITRLTRRAFRCVACGDPGPGVSTALAAPPVPSRAIYIFQRRLCAARIFPVRLGKWFLGGLVALAVPRSLLCLPADHSEKEQHGSTRGTCQLPGVPDRPPAYARHLSVLTARAPRPRAVPTGHDAVRGRWGGGWVRVGWAILLPAAFCGPHRWGGARGRHTARGTTGTPTVPSCWAVPWLSGRHHIFIYIYSASESR